MSAPSFAGRVAGVFATRVLQFLSTIAVAFLLARLLGPQGRGAYALLLLLPSTLFALGQLGLPSAVTFYAGRGRSLGSLIWLAAVASIGLPAILIPLTLLALPTLEQGVFQAAPHDLLRVALIALPIQFGASLFGSILWGRQLVRRYTMILAAQSVSSLVVVVALVGIAHLEVVGALVANLMVTGTASLIVLYAVLRAARTEAAGGPPERPVRLPELASYGIRLYPASISTFLSYRSDIFLLGLLIGDAGQIGLYTLAVSLAELVFHVPDAIATILYPRVAAAERAEADRIAPSMTRFALFVTLIAAAGLIPAALIAVRIVLPAFGGSIVPFLVLVPGTIALSISKVVSGYVSGLGRPLPVGVISIAALVVNVSLNLVFIPAFGITGAALSSLISYSMHALLMVAVASRLASTPMRTFLLAGPPEARRLWERARQLAMRRS